MSEDEAQKLGGGCGNKGCAHLPMKGRKEGRTTGLCQLREHRGAVRMCGMPGAALEQVKRSRRGVRGRKRLSSTRRPYLSRVL
eukprot:366463-Chlamydomonas_euryale.AAC.7